ncbi:protein THEMIS [Xenopus tropicalis]|uniref:Protein THEMIS n=1 Tax=Xenopus tropicalis TaxID=8364 RepID=F6UMP6_XENTR|nr:protein THEMIS [Xenopus tropicalis]
MATSLEQFINTLDPKTLPRVLQIQSGYYYGGSIYELFGNECSISTGDIIKVIGYKVTKVLAYMNGSTESNEVLATTELPLDFPGLFKVVADKRPYCTIEEIIRTLHVGPTRFGHPSFHSANNLDVAGITISKDDEILIRSIEEVNGVTSVNCGVIRKGHFHSFLLPLSCEGVFYECPDEKIYTLKEILEWKIPKSRSRAVILTEVIGTCDIKQFYQLGANATMILKPVYDVQAIMQFRKDIVHLQSDLDIEVLDITNNFNIKCFIQTLTIHDVFELTTNEFPMIAEIIEHVAGEYAHCNLLSPGKKIIIHKKDQADRIIASELRSDSPNKHFLIPDTYKGKFKRRPRCFPTVYDLKVAKREADELHVVATKPFQSAYKEFSSICVGDQFLVKQHHFCEIMDKGKKTVVEVLTFLKINGKAREQVTIPLYAEGGFLEVVYDERQYYIKELCKHFHFPLNVKVSVRDLFAMGEDILASTSVLQLEEHITDSYLLVSSYDSPQEVWELPVHRLNLSVHIIGSFQGETFCLPTKTNIEEINKEEYYMVRRYEGQVQRPPPRPPKTPLFACESAERESNPIFTENPTPVEDCRATLELQGDCQGHVLCGEKDKGGNVEVSGEKDKGDNVEVSGEKDKGDNVEVSSEKGTAMTVFCKDEIHQHTIENHVEDI